ncbi:glycosyltransferase [Streptomyces sp. OM5714]|uniref:glycosyltransferase family 2 protein n=1 Tax=Streptomyces sp. OM5714 TaxID=2602736 RepID=UPI0013DA4418|nr:glycosyltransferase [Streptomyces sp. OM5714]KAF2774634.1 glycosyl transferase family 2 [Streptomyces sp. OM5714]
MTDTFRVAVIPTRDRHDLLTECVGSVVDQVDRVIIIDNLSDPPVDVDQWHGKVGVVRIPVDPPNISSFWNVGIALADGSAHHAGAAQWDIVVLNSDVVVPPGWTATLSAAMRSTSAVLAYPDQHGGREQLLHTKAIPVDLRQRITGYAYMLRGETGLRLDEDLVWWYGDDDLDWRAREQGGALLVPGLAVDHRCPNGSLYERPELEQQTARDRETFAAKWGRTPW